MQQTLLVCAVIALGVFSSISGGLASGEERAKKDCLNCDAYFPDPPYLWEYESTRKLRFCQKTRSVGTEEGSFYETKTNQEETDTYSYPNSGSQAQSAQSVPAQRSSLIEEGNIMRNARFAPMDQPAPIQKIIPVADSVSYNPAK